MQAFTLLPQQILKYEIEVTKKGSMEFDVAFFLVPILIFPLINFRFFMKFIISTRIRYKQSTTQRIENSTDYAQVFKV